MQTLLDVARAACATSFPFVALSRGTGRLQLPEIIKTSDVFGRILVILGIAGGLTYLAISTANDAADTFSRSVTGGWGSAESGGTYTLVGTTSDFAVNGAAGTMTLAPNATRVAYLGRRTPRDVDLTVRVTTDKLPAGGGQMAYLVARRVSNGMAYLARLRFATDGSVRLQAVQELAGEAITLGREKVVPRVTQTPNSFIWLRAQVVGANPTTISLKAWADGQAEPAGWQYSVTDTAPSLQVAGPVGLRAYLGSTATNAPVLFSFDNFRVISVAAP